jgi:small-conductance mechanosensitive channel
LKDSRYQLRTFIALVVWSAAAAVCFGLWGAGFKWFELPGPGQTQGQSILLVLGMIAVFLVLMDLATLVTQWFLGRKSKPLAEAKMVSRLYRLVVALIIILVVAWGFNTLAGFGQLFALFGGMLLGFSLQAPVSGFAAWVLVSVKRPFRPGDRIQFPSLGLVGDVKEIGLMYTVLDQVGGTIGSEEAVGRYILVPNAMLFSQVVINYTVVQEYAYMLDEVVVRITYDSDWERAEKILLDAAHEITADIIEATGQKPYIRSDLYDYGVYLRLRYQTQVKQRPEIAYRITRKIFEDIQHDPTVDLAIPFVYSYRAAADRKEEGAVDHSADETLAVQDIPVDHIRFAGVASDPQVIERIAQSIRQQGLLQPIVVVKDPKSDFYDILAGQTRYEACKHLGWKTMPAVVRGGSTGSGVR